MFINSKFTIDGLASSAIGAKGASIVRTDASPVSSQIFGSRSIKQDKSSRGRVPTFYGIDQENIEFDLKITFADGLFTKDNLINVAKIFSSCKYVPFTTDEYPGIVFYVITTAFNVVRNGDYMGWIELHLVTGAPFAFATKTTSTFDLTGISVPTDISVTNPSNVPNVEYGGFIYCPKMTIALKGATTAFTLTNKSNSNDIFGMTGLTALETLTIDNQLRKIASTTGDPRFANITDKKWFKLVGGANVITVSAPMVITMELLFPMYI